MYYYCIVCKELHEFEESRTESADAQVIFKTGYHYFNDALYHAGMCETAECSCRKVQSATA